MGKYVVVDIDGTIAKVSDNRLKFLQQKQKDWDTFYKLCFNDEPIQEMIDLVQTLIDSQKYQIAFCTGRRESVFAETAKWIHKYLDTDTVLLLMRKHNDFRHDTEVKPELLSENGITPKNTLLILEDRASMCKKWRELGFRCLQVDNGEF